VAAKPQLAVVPNQLAVAKLHRVAVLNQLVAAKLQAVTAVADVARSTAAC
jgi:hypothetical protein